MSGGKRKKRPSKKRRKAERRYKMAEKKMTRAQALEFAVETIRNYEGDCEAVEVLNKMLIQVTKPRKKSDAPTKTQILNRGLAEKCYDAIAAKGEAVSSKWLIEHVNGLLTPQKTTAVMRILIEDGRIVRNKEGKTISYAIAE